MKLMIWTKSFLLLVFCAFLMCSHSTDLFAQHYGVKAGLVMSNVTGQTTGSLLPGFQMGAYTKLGGEEVLTFKIEFLLTQKGSSNYNRDNLRNINLFYAEVPLLFNLELTNKLNLHFGFAPSMLLLGSYRYSEDGSIRRRSVGREFTPFDYSTFIGAEYLWNDKMLFGFRYNHSFVPLRGYNSEFFRNGRLPLNRVFQLYCGYRIK